MAEFKSTISSQDFDKALQGGLDYAADKSGIQETLKELSAKGFVYIGPDQPTDGTMYWLDTSVDEPDVPVVPDEPDVPVDPDEPDEPVVPDNPDEPVYVLASPATFTAGDKVLTDTGYVLGDEDKDWTIVSDVSGKPGYGKAAWCCGGELGLWSVSAWSWKLGYSTPAVGNVQVATGTVTNMKTVVAHKKGEETLTVYYVSDSALASAVDSGETYTAWRGKWSTSTVTLGGQTNDDNRYWTGTVNDFKIYERVLTEAEIEAYMGAAQAPDLTSISATYSGGDVAVGTALTSLTGIVVTATYSDGSTAPVTGYTLSGTIAEGSNTITVIYEGKTATFTVTGVAAEDTSELMCASNIVLANHKISKNTQYDFYQLDALDGANVYEIPVEAGATYELSVYHKYSGTPQWGDANLAVFNDNLSGVIAEKLTNFETVGSRINGYDFVASDRDTNVVQTPVATGGYKNTITMTPTIDGYFYCDDRNVVANGYPAMSVKKVVS